MVNKERNMRLRVEPIKFQDYLNVWPSFKYLKYNNLSVKALDVKDCWIYKMRGVHTSFQLHVRVGYCFFIFNVESYFLALLFQKLTFSEN